MRTKRFEEESKDFGLKLKRIRTKMGLSAEEVAKAAQIATTTYREWENGRSITGLPYKALAKILGVSVASLFNEESIPNASEIMDAVTDIDEAVKKIKMLI